jgi:hypothetical protein
MSSMYAFHVRCLAASWFAALCGEAVSEIRRWRFGAEGGHKAFVLQHNHERVPDRRRLVRSGNRHKGGESARGAANDATNHIM